MALISLRIRLIEALFALLAKLPVGFMNAMGVAIGRLMVGTGRRRNTTVKNLAACFPEKTREQREQLRKDHAREFGRTLSETAWTWNWPLAKLMDCIEEVRGIEYLEAAKASGQGIMFAAPHCGAWEILGLYLQTVADMAILFKAPKSKDLEPLLIRQRARGGAKVFPAGSGGIRSLFKHLKQGGAVGILPDQQPKSGEGRFAPFFGVPAITMTLAPKLARKTRCQVLFCICERLPGPASYRVHFFPADTDVYSADEPRALLALNRGVEQCAEINLPQYLWCYKRFKIQPEGSPSFYD